MTPSNPIEKTPGYKVGNLFMPTLIEAQKEALKQIFPDGVSMNRDDIADALLNHAEKITAILDPPKALIPRQTRKDKGTKRASKKAAAPATT